MGCWKQLITEVCWPEMCSYLHQGDPVAIPLRSLEVLWHPAPLTERRIRPIAPNCSVRTAMVQALGQVMDRCKWMQGRENVNLYQLSW